MYEKIYMYKTTIKLRENYCEKRQNRGEAHMKNKILAIKHYANDCIYKEAQYYIENKKCDKEVIQEQIQKYKEEK